MELEQWKTEALFDLEGKSAGAYLTRFLYPWEALGGIGAWIREYAATLSREEYEEVAPGAFVSKRARVAPTAYLGEGCIVEAGAEVRHGAYIRGNAFIGKGSVVGNSTEVKNAILIERVEVPHYNYVGDSIFGTGAHLGAGAIASNLKCDGSNVWLHTAEGKFPTGLRKFGAILGDGAQVGCNAVLCPGCLVGKGAVIYPLVRVRGAVPAQTLQKSETVQVSLCMEGDAK